MRTIITNNGIVNSNDDFTWISDIKKYKDVYNNEVYFFNT